MEEEGTMVVGSRAEFTGSSVDSRPTYLDNPDPDPVPRHNDTLSSDIPTVAFVSVSGDRHFSASNSSPFLLRVWFGCKLSPVHIPS